MARRPQRKSHRATERPPFACVALVLQGGGALGSYQAGVYQALSEAELEPDWIAGISIGALNCALIAGNPPEKRVERLKAFWEAITTDLKYTTAHEQLAHLLDGDLPRSLFSGLSSTVSMVRGQPGFYAPRLPPPFLQLPGSAGATSFYDTSELKSTLERFVDFDRINKSPMRFSVGAVNVRSGNFTYFDNRTHHIRAEHVMASGALPPGFPAVEIDGELYWDGGMVSNTPLQWVLEATPRQDTLAFQVDLWSARGNLPRDLFEVEERGKEIRYSSRTRQNTDFMRTLQQARRAVAALLDKLPPELADSHEAAMLRPMASEVVYNIVHLIYRSKNYENHAKDYEFSRLSMMDHWEAGYNDAVRTLRYPEIFERPEVGDCVRTFDLTLDGRD